MIGAALSSKAVAIAFAATLTTGTAAAAATGVLPGTADDESSAVVSQDDTADDQGGSKQEDEAADAGSDNSEHGSEVSQLATTTELTGRDKGIAISALASGGRSHAGDVHGQSADHSAKPAAADEAVDPSEDAATDVDAPEAGHGSSQDQDHESGNPND